MTPKLTSFVTLLYLLLLATTLSAQVVTGKVVDGYTHKPIANANIYFSGTYSGTTSNSSGNFRLNVVNPNFPLMISYVGYKSEIVNNYSGKNLIVNLEPKPIELRGVIIGADKLNHEKEMEIFMREFIGGRSKDCTISNPNDIYFTWFNKTGTLIANADKPLLIYNKRLGYGITYFLGAFKYSPSEVLYQGNYFFADSSVNKKPAEIIRILKARNAAYYGSRMHFIRALVSNSIADEDFALADSDGNWPSHNEIIKMHDGQTYISIKKTLTINYDGNISYIRLAKKNTEVITDGNGYADNKLIWSGYMANQRVNQLLPFEFVPQPLVKRQSMLK